MSSSPDSVSTEEDEFIVEKIIAHREFDTLVQEATIGNNVFLPKSIEEDKRIHAKYGYLVHWAKYEVKDRTWEPEDNLLGVLALANYKQEKNLPSIYETFDRRYHPEVYSKLHFHHDRMKGQTQHLLSKEEKRRKLEKMSERQQKKKDRPRERMVSPEDPERLMKQKEERRKEKKKREREEQPGTSGILPNEFKIPRKDRGSTDDNVAGSSAGSSSMKSSQSSAYKQKEQMPDRPPGATLKSDLARINLEPARPGIQPLASNTPRIQKKSKLAETIDNSVTSTAAEPSAPPVEDPCELRQVQWTLSSESIPKGSVLSAKLKDWDQPMRPAEIKQSLKKAPVEKPSLQKRLSVEIIEIDDDTMPSASAPVSASSSMSSGSRKKMDMESSSVTPVLSAKLQKKKNEEMDKQIRESIKAKKRAIREVKEEMKKFPLKLSGERYTRPLNPPLDVMKIRKWKSAEQLNEKWTRKGEHEIFCKNFSKSYFLPDDQTKRIFIRQYPAEDPPYKPRKASEDSEDSEEKAREMESNKLFLENWRRVLEVIHRSKVGDSKFKKTMERLVEEFSKDDHLQFLEVFEKNLPPQEDLLSFQYFAILIITTHCRHRFWRRDITGKSLVDSKMSQKWGKVRQHEVICCEDHRKCRWMEVFLKLLPVDLRFIETTPTNWTGTEDEDGGPFRDDIFFHCMREGAECQKDLFFKYAKPIGIQEDMEGEYSVDVMHLLAVQHGNIQRISAYLANGGLDINAIATHVPTNQVLRLGEYLQWWTDQNVEDWMQEKYYNRLIEFVRLTSENLQFFVEVQVENSVHVSMTARWRTSIDITYPHILRCSPLNNIENGGDNTHQVLSCLFYPQSFGVREGLPDEGSGPYDPELVEKLRISHRKYQRLVSEQKGRLILAVFRVKIEFAGRVEEDQPYTLPKFSLVPSDQGFNIEKMTILRQKEGLEAEEADIGMVEFKKLASPGCRFFGLTSDEVERKLIVPGNAHIEMTGSVTEPMSFVVQLFFLRKKSIVD